MTSLVQRHFKSYPLHLAHAHIIVAPIVLQPGGFRVECPAMRPKPVRMRAAEPEGFAPQVKNFVRQAERDRGAKRAAI
jgi:hypothetical protein